MKNGQVKPMAAAMPPLRKVKMEEKNQDGYGGCLATLAIVGTIIVSVWALTILFERLGISVLEGGAHSTAYYIALIVGMVAAGTGACLFWKQSAIIRRTAVVTLYLGAFLLAWTVLALEMADFFSVAFLFLFFVGILLLVGALPWKNATVGQCILLLLKILGAYVPLVLSGILAAALHLFTRHSNSDIINMSPLFLLLIGLCLTVYLLYLAGIKLSRFFSPMASKDVPMLLFFVGSTLTLFMLFVTVFLFLLLFAIDVAHRHHQPFAIPVLESDVPVVDIPEPFDPDIQVETISPD